MLGYLSADIICSEWRTVFRERSSRKTVSYKPQIEAIVFIILQIFYATRAVLKIIGEYPRILPSFCWGIFTHVTRLDQSRASKNIWWIINTVIHVRSLANFYGQYVDRHMNLKFMRRVSERERAIRQFVIVKNKLMSVCNAPVLLLTMNFVIQLSK